MWKRVGLWGIVCLVAVAGYGVGLCDYRTAETVFRIGRISFFYQHADDANTPGPDLSSGWLSFEARQQRDGPTIGFTLGAKGDLQLYNLGLARTRLGATGALRQYIADKLPLYTYGGGDVTWDSANVQPGVEAQAGIGYGRFYNVSPLAKAIAVEEYLLQKALLAAPRDNVADLLELADVIGQAAADPSLGEAVARVVEHLERRWEVVLDIPQVLAVEAILGEAVRHRYCGWTAQAGIAYRIVDPRAAPRDLLFSLSLDAAIAPQRNSQLLLQTKLTKPASVADKYTLSADITLDVRVNGALSFAARYTLFLDKPPGQRPAGTQSASFQLDLTQGWGGLTIQMEFSKRAEAVAWGQSIVLSASAHLW